MIQHDYKSMRPATGRAPLRLPLNRWPWFAGGVAIPIIGMLLITGGPVAAPERGPDAGRDHTANAVGAAIERAAEPVAESVPEPAPEVDAVAPSATVALAEPAPPPVTDPVIPTVAERPLVLAPERLDADTAPERPQGEQLELTVARGDTLERLFRRHDLSINDMMAVLGDDTARRHLSILRPGDRLLVRRDGSRVLGVTRELDEVRVLRVSRGDDGFSSTVGERPVETRVVTAHATINSSLFNAGRSAGLSDSVTMNVAGLFQWDIDFALEIRQGDEFTVVYEQRWRDGERLRDGSILAAEFVNRGRSHRAVRFEMEDGADYFTPDGKSVRKAFIRAPVDFTRISSNFNPNRRHPILNTIRAHRGVDYAAPTGTPIRAAGDGRVIFRGVQGGYGNTVILQHGGNITTLYAHASRFHPDVRVGTRVRQGQTIAYVGMTGAATGPHLHYEYRVNGVHRNPRTVELPPADPVPSAYRDRFAAAVAPLLDELDQVRETRLAMIDD